MKTTKLIRSRRSVRSFDGAAPDKELLDDILRYAASVETPYSLPIEWRVLDAKAQKLSCPVITGTDSYIAGKLRREMHAEEAFGFAFERVVLYAVSKGLGTTWIAGTLDRPAFERAMELREGEVMPCVSPLGRPAAKMSLRESMMRKGVKADSTPLTPDKAGDVKEALELVRLAPSAVNKQPWRAVVCGDTVHFYEKQSRGLAAANGWDIQKVDVGIALCHFVCAMEEGGRKTVFTLADPSLPHPADTVYIASIRIG